MRERWQAGHGAKTQLNTATSPKGRNREGAFHRLGIKPEMERGRWQLRNHDPNQHVQQDEVSGHTSNCLRLSGKQNRVQL